METTTAVLVAALLLALGVAAWWWRQRRGPPPVTAAPEEPTTAWAVFEPGPPRGTSSTDFEQQSPDWKSEMAAAGARLAKAGVAATVFVNGTFVGTDPLSAVGVVERVLPVAVGARLGQALRETSRKSVSRLLGDLGHFGDGYVQLFEQAIGQRIACSHLTWSSENHHVGRVEGALRLVRALATHAELAELETPRLLVLGHSHAGQLFALVTQLLARSVSADAIVDVARARRLDVSALQTDLATLSRTKLDFVTFGAPARYAWATLPMVRVLHVLGVPSSGARALDGDWIQRLAVEGSDLPPLSSDDRRVNAHLSATLGPGFSPLKAAASLRADPSAPSGALALVEYGGKGLKGFLGHAAYTRLDAMLFHARLITDRLYPLTVVEATPPLRRWRW
jgi:hypothetical protein